MFASLKSKIKEETGSDITKLTSNWRSGSFLSRISARDDSSTATPTSSSTDGAGCSTSEESSPSQRADGPAEPELHQLLTSQLEVKLRERDAAWRRKMDDLQLSLASEQDSAAASAAAVARAAAAAAAEAGRERDAARAEAQGLRARLAAAERAQERLDAVTEELESARRSWSAERGAARAAAAAADAAALEARGEVDRLRAMLPPEHELHRMHDDDKRSLPAGGSCAECARRGRERAVLARQLQEARLALADVKTSWSGQIAALETQVARLSRQAGEEGAERRRAEAAARDARERLDALAADLDKARQQLANSEAKVSRLSGEAHSLTLETRALRAAAEARASADLEGRSAALAAANEALRTELDAERARARRLQAAAAAAAADAHAGELQELRDECFELQKRCAQEQHDKDEALLRNAHVSQTLAISDGNAAHWRREADDAKAAAAELRAQLAAHAEKPRVCSCASDGTAAAAAAARCAALEASEAALRAAARETEDELAEKTKKIKSLEQCVADMKKSLQQELAAARSGHGAAAEQEINRRYLKHVVLRFLTSRELEARQLTRALAALLQLSAAEESLLTRSPRLGRPLHA